MLVDLKNTLSNGTLLSMLRSDSGCWQVLQNQAYRWLTLDNIVQSIMSLKDNSELLLPHQQPLAELTLALKPDANVLEFGLGGGSNCRHIFSHKPNVDYHLAEIDASVIELFKQFFNPANLPIQLANQSALDFTSQCQSSFDLIITDIFASKGSIMETINSNFLMELSQILKTNGTLYINFLPETPFETQMVLARLQQLELQIDFAEKVTGFRNHLFICKKLS